MRTRLLLSRFLLLLITLLTTATSYASHFQGGQLTYEVVPGVANRYKFTLRVFNDCGGTAVYSTATFSFKSAGCMAAPGDPAPITASLISTSVVVGSPYCAGPGAPVGANQCGMGLPTNYQIARYEALVTLPPKAEWRISVTDNARPSTGNLVGQDDIHYEAVLRNLVGGQTIQNNSTPFESQNAPIQFVGWKQPTFLSQMTTDVDGDSLVYSLQAPLRGCNNPIGYQSLGTGPYIDITSDNGGTPCLGQLPAGLLTYSATFPLPSFTFSGTCPLKTAATAFAFSAANGSMFFTPYFYTVGLDRPENKYVVVVQVDEYRRINNVPTLIGSTRRDMLFIVVDGGANQNPTVGPLRINSNSTSVPVSTVIPAVAGQLVSVQLTGTDPNPTQTVALSSNAEQVLPNADFVASNPSTQPTGTLNWLPPATLRPGLYYCTVTTTDNACPIKGVTQQTLTFRVTNTTLATKATQQMTTLAAVPTPFRGQVRFQLAQPGVQTVVVFDHLGRSVSTLRSQANGEVTWQPGAQVPAGLYLARSADGRQVARLLRTDSE
jgi:hypothetical protein